MCSRDRSSSGLGNSAKGVGRGRPRSWTAGVVRRCKTQLDRTKDPTWTMITCSGDCMKSGADDSSASFAIRGQLGGWSRFTYLVSTLDTNESDHRTELQVDRPVEHDPGRADRVDQLLDPAHCAARYLPGAEHRSAGPRKLELPPVSYTHL